MRDLPSEVLQAILRAVRVSSLQVPDFSLTTCLRVCSLWRDVGTPLLYIDVILNNSSLQRFTENSKSAGIALTRSLSLKIKPERAAEAGNPISPSSSEISSYAEERGYITANGSSETRALWSSLVGLASTFSRTVKLESFSLLVTSNYPDFKPEGFWLRGSDIGNVVASLPSTLRHLEIDTRGYDRNVFPAQHFCPKLASRLPYLQTLRLRLATLCPQILELAYCDTTRETSTLDQGSLLECVVINLIGRDHNSTITLCEDTEKIAACTASNIAYRLALDSCHHLRTSLVSRFEECLSSYVFPSISRLSITDLMHSSGEMGYNFPTINDRNLVQQATTSNPYYNIDRSTALHYKDAKGEDALVIGDFLEIGAFAEGNAWMETINGSRFPESFKTSARCREGKYSWSVPQVQDRETYKAKPHVEPTWWGYEQNAGRLLLRARVTDGVGDVEAMERECSQEELDDDADDRRREADLFGGLLVNGCWRDNQFDGDSDADE